MKQKTLSLASPAAILPNLVRGSPTVLYARRARPPFSFTFVSENAPGVLGVPAEALTRGVFAWTDAIHPDDLERVRQEVAAAAHGAGARTIDYRWRVRQGEWCWLRDRIQPMQRDGPELLGALTDITVWKRSEEALDLSRRRLQALFNYSLDGILLVNNDGNYIEANPAACDLTGYSRQELLKKSIWDLVAPDGRAIAEARWDTLLTTGETSGDSAFVRADGTIRHAEFRAVAHVMPDAHLVVARDVTERLTAEAARQQYLSRLEVLSEIDRAILKADTPASAADAALRRIARLIPCARASVWLLGDANLEGTTLAVWTERPTAVVPGTRMPMDKATFLGALLNGRAVHVAELAGAFGHERWEGNFLAEGLRGFMAVPLRTDDRTIGALSIWPSATRPFSQLDEDTAKELADRLSVAIGNARLLEQSRTSAARLVAISRRLLDVQEADRQEIARELHDEVGQTLTGLKLGLGAAQRAAEGAVAENLRHAQRLVDDLLAQVRRLSLNLRPPALDAMGLTSALAWHFERYTSQTQIAVRFQHEGIEGRFSLQTETAAYRIVQESLTNVARHAGVGEVRVDVHADAGWIHIVVEDAGCGFDVAAAAAAAAGRVTAGLTGMEERATLLGGRFRIESAPGRTAIMASIPSER